MFLSSFPSIHLVKSLLLLQKSEALLGLSNEARNPLFECISILPPLLCSVHIGRRLVVGAAKHGDNGDHDCFDRLDRRPSFSSRLVSVGVVAGRMEDGDTDAAIGKDIGVPHLRGEAAGRRRVGVVLGETQPSVKEPSLAATRGAWRSGLKTACAWRMRDSL
jgi:hypothetical protein